VYCREKISTDLAKYVRISGLICRK